MHLCHDWQPVYNNENFEFETSTCYRQRKHGRSEITNNNKKYLRILFVGIFLKHKLKKKQENNSDLVCKISHLCLLQVLFILLSFFFWLKDGMQYFQINNGNRISMGCLK